MTCPACDQALTEHDAQCAGCGFSMAVAEHEFGVPPTLQGPVSDPKNVLSRSEKKKLVAFAREIEGRFPQARIVIAVRESPDAESFRAHAFWLFNRSGLCSQVEKGGACHLIFLLLDPVLKKMAVMPGYGLEPFIGRDALAECLAAAKSSLSAGRFFDGILAALRAIETRLRDVTATAPRTFGLSPDRTLMDDGGHALDPAAAIYLPAY
jgi:uncharacterized membrane protein YgcG